MSRFPKNFTPEEFACKCGECSIPYPDRIRHLAWTLQYMRNTTGPIKINSAYRCPDHNKAVGGSEHSQHMECTAADIFCVGMTPEETADFLEHLMKCGAIPNGGLGRYKTFTHIDIRDYPARWGSND